MSIDDACASDVRVAQLAREHGIKTVFYWPVEWVTLAKQEGYEPLDFRDALDIAREFEVGSHAITHRLLTRIPEGEAKWEIRESQERLENLLGLPVERFCPPRGYTNPELTDYTLKLYKSQRLTKGAGLVHIHPNSGVNDHRPWRELVTQDCEIWGHSWELDKFDLWDELEEVMREGH